MAAAVATVFAGARASWLTSWSPLARALPMTMVAARAASTGGRSEKQAKNANQNKKQQQQRSRRPRRDDKFDVTRYAAFAAEQQSAQSKGPKTINEPQYRTCSIRMEGYNHAVLDSYVTFLERAARELGISCTGRIPLPTHKRRETVLKSPHVYKQHRVQFDIATHARLFQMRNLSHSTLNTYLTYVQHHLPPGVATRVKLPVHVRERHREREETERETQRETESLSCFKILSRPAFCTTTMASPNNNDMAAHATTDEQIAQLFLENPVKPENKYARFMKENPFVPAFIGATGLCLAGGFVAYRNGNQSLSQTFQRGRVIFQGLTIASLIYGTWDIGLKKDDKPAQQQ
ncbi:uncharacterized protein MONBRDRAFT_34344 [Monosiga brevicollis MX1]|uniref:Small ribosomal subunit protein uS10m n=1 Tax=Monosiga brevicollis TaxID=81824 RepID=A9VB28_MONBE|nr:uncharacterized protein MONBRDRAFT_34344 [Monosiga brevicollis MX1]EDQ85320.1 predicted protein [Monosiga brevicollis MX1]|eukprot:XP_001749941.1 hypothetical protein [Monosiga brevicollis MX1]